MDENEIYAYYGICVLVDHIKNDESSESIDSMKMTYTDFCEKINEFDKENNADPQEIKHALSIIGDSLEKFDSKAPLITILIINKNSRVPGVGFNKFYTGFSQLGDTEKDKVIKEQKELIKKYLGEGKLDKFLLEKVPSHYRTSMPTQEDDNFEVMEGMPVKKHREIEDRSRNNAIVLEKKRQSKYICECCDFNFYKTYGELGKEYIECHHIKPLAEYSEEGEEIVLENLAALCANCHRMIHRLLIRDKAKYKDKYSLSMDDLRDIVKKR